LKSSFWVGVIWIVTLGWAAVYSSATFFQNDIPGSWFALCHQVIVTAAEAALADGDAAPLGAAADAAADATTDGAAEGAMELVAPLEQALNNSAMTPSTPTSRLRVVTA
jgi:hypothetical protein